jgi:hypothetical protein
LLLVQGSLHHMQEKLRLFPALTYIWTLAVVHQSRGKMPWSTRPFSASWSPVFVFCKGKLNRRALPVVKDAFRVKDFEKRWHQWEQPLAPWKYWLKRLTLPGELIADTFCGGGTIGVAVRDIGQRSYLGTDICERSVKAVRKRLSISC